MLRNLWPLLFLLAGFIWGGLQVLGWAGNIATALSLGKNMDPQLKMFLSQYGALAVSTVGLIWLVAIGIVKRWSPLKAKPQLKIISYGILPAPVPASPYVIHVQNTGDSDGEFEGQIRRIKRNRNTPLFVRHSSMAARWLGSRSKSITLLSGQRDALSLGVTGYRWNEATKTHELQLVIEYRNPIKPHDICTAQTDWVKYTGGESEVIDEPRQEVEIVFSSRPSMKHGPLKKQYMLLPGRVYETTKVWHKLHTWYRMRRNRPTFIEGPITVSVQISGYDLEGDSGEPEE